MTNVVIADDHLIFRQGVEAALDAAGYKVVGSVGDGATALAAVAETRPDILILDIRMPGRGGVSTLERLREAGDRTPVVILATEVDDDALIAAMNAGADAIIRKDCAEHRLFDAMKAVREGARFIDGDLLERAFALAQGKPRTTPLDQLTERERKIAHEVAQGCSNREIGVKMSVTEGTVKVYLHNIYTKLGLKNRTELAMLFREG